MQNGITCSPFSCTSKLGTYVHCVHFSLVTKLLAYAYGSKAQRGLMSFVNKCSKVACKLGSRWPTSIPLDLAKLRRAKRGAFPTKHEAASEQK